MIEIIKYQAFDGTIFSNEQECETYEKARCKEFYNENIKFFDENRKLLDFFENPYKAYEKVKYAKITSQAAANYVFEVLSDTYFVFPDVWKVLPFPGNFLEVNGTWMTLEEYKTEQEEIFNLFS